MKQWQMIELQRMKLFMDTQVQLKKIKQAKLPASDVHPMALICPYDRMGEQHRIWTNIYIPSKFNHFRFSSQNMLHLEVLKDK